MPWLSHGPETKKEQPMKQFKIQHTNKSMADAIQQKIDHLNKPKGSLGR